ncbi:MAG: amidase [Alphaproteobacteria bacterium]|jgi:amidase|nr:amidase [Alphaproteobacteria bacterium]MDP6566211.1 amidase [Alphaproteobacteria bacterium]MDP6813989.1 amidase [Alphaproteobacteria bacterium]
MTDVTLQPAVEQARLIREGKLGAVELLEGHLARYERHNPALNAIIFTQVDKAMARAREADKAMAKGEVWGPLHGLSMTIKDSYDWVGAPSTWGIPEMAENYPERDSVAVRRLEKAGAIIYGKTNIPLLLADWQSFNDIYGTTNNPWDLGRTPGGSSGGSAAALASGMTSLEVGSDIGASIRNPAHYCGVFGHKPTMGVVPQHGHQLPGDHSFLDIAAGGPLARGADDLAMIFDVLTGPAGGDAIAWRLELPPSEKTKLSDFKVGVLLDSPVCQQDDELTDQLQATIDALAKAGVRIDARARPDIDLARCQHVYLLLLRAATGTHVSDAAFAENLAGAAGRGADDLSYRAYVDRGVTLYHRDWWQLHNEREAMRLRWAAFFRDYDLLLCPAAASAAFPHDHQGERPERTIPINGTEQPTTDQLFWAGLPGVVLLPAAVAPAGLTRSGLPCGLQIIAGYLRDRTALDFARLMERELGGFQAPPGYE